MVNVTCAFCEKIFGKEKGEYNRKIREGHQTFYCSRICLSQDLTGRTKHKEIELKCKICGKPFISSTKPRSPTTCSIRCATYLGHPEFLLPKVKKAKKPVGLSKHPVNCQICGIEFYPRNSYKKAKTCSKECRSELQSILSRTNPNCGGETNYKKIFYQDRYFDSTWEVEFVIWMDENNIEWIRDKKINFKWIDNTGKAHRYCPDFYLPNHDIFIDTKNKYLMIKDAEKIKDVRDRHGITLYAGDLEFCKYQVLIRDTLWGHGQPSGWAKLAI